MGNFEKVKIVLIDDNDLFREGIKRILESTDQFDIISVGHDFNAVIDVMDEEPEIILMDADLYYKGDVQGIFQIITEHSFMKLVLFTDSFANIQVLAALEAGIKGFFTKEMNVSLLIEGLKAVNKGKYWIHPHVSDALVHEYVHATDHVGQQGFKHARFISKPDNLFTDREYQVLQLLASGYNNMRISEKLKVTQSTVKNHVTNIFTKMNVNDRTQAVIKAVQNNWVEVKYEEVERV